MWSPVVSKENRLDISMCRVWCHSPLHFALSTLSRLMTTRDGRVYLDGLGPSALPLDMSEIVIKYVKDITLVSPV